MLRDLAFLFSLFHAVAKAHVNENGQVVILDYNGLGDNNVSE